ncbi:hypothetical protein EJB05_27126 [Eragrostis curvula]|uniref:Uncharacterized protein n=1 Tax=Eragrostis curvula TaxID=38414 RepID=A0A5J9UMK7_9POAL|nr:hypothetical protein EJB05_27126 [Eragrostis curvula]
MRPARRASAFWSFRRTTGLGYLGKLMQLFNPVRKFISQATNAEALKELWWALEQGICHMHLRSLYRWFLDSDGQRAKAAAQLIDCPK